MNVPRQNAGIRRELDAAIADCLDTSQFLQGQRVARFESAYAEFCGARFAVGCGNGTDALYLAVKALGIGVGDDVLVPAMTFAATAEAVALAGARPVIVDVNEYGLLDVAVAEGAWSPRTKAIIFVGLYGQLRGLESLAAWARERSVGLIADVAQAHGARCGGKPAEAYADVACTSFYPGKNLGACGDAGGCTTNDETLWQDMAMRRDHGRSGKYRHELVGVNMRMDELQGAVLNVKLPHLRAWTERRRAIASIYHQELAGIDALTLPLAAPADSVWHLYVIQTDARDELARYLAELGVATGIHYPVPLHRQPAFETGQDCPTAESLARRALSLPMFETMTAEEAGLVTKGVLDFFAQG